MQSRLPVSKPVLLVIVGLVIGASLGLGSGYAFIYPNLVNERSATIEERVEYLETNITLIDDSISNVEESISEINDGIQSILALSDVLDEVGNRISDIENGQITLNSELDQLEGTMNALNQEFVDLGDEWDSTVDEFADLQASYEAAENELQSVQELVRETDGIRIFKTHMANPSDFYKEAMTDELYALLLVESSEFSAWATLVGTDTAKVILQEELELMLGGLVWNPTENTEVGDESYQVKLETYFNFEFQQAGVTLNNIRLEVRASINIFTETINQPQISLIEVV